MRSPKFQSDSVRCQARAPPQEFLKSTSQMERDGAIVLNSLVIAVFLLLLRLKDAAFLL